MFQKLLSLFVFSFLSFANLTAQDCPTPNSTPQLSVQSFDGTNVTLAFSTPNPNVYTDYSIIVTNRDMMMLGVKTELSFSLADMPSTNGYGFYIMTYNQADLDVAVPNLSDALSLVCAGIDLSPVNGHYPASSILLGILNNCPALINGGSLITARDLLCQLPIFVPGVTMPFGMSSEMVTGINAAQTNPLSANIIAQNNQWLVEWKNNNTQSTQITVYNSTGQVIEQAQLPNNQSTYTIDAQQLSSGLYMVQINNGQTTSVAKMLK